MTKKITKKFLTKQRQFFESKAPEILYSGAFGAGKTRILVEKALMLGSIYPGIDIGIFRKTRTSLTHTTLKSFLDILPKEYIKSYNKAESHIELINGSEYIFGGMEEPSRWGSLELGAVFCDELIEFDEEDYLMLLGRLRQKILVDSSGVRRILPFRQAGSATNPGSPSHWLYKRGYQDDLMEVFESKTSDNIYNPKSYLKLLGRFKGRYKDRYVLGLWISFEGSVYDIWDPLIHIVKPYTIEDTWRKIRVIDFGYTAPFCCLWMAEDPYGNLLVYRQLYGSHRLVEDWAEDIVKLSRGETYEATLADWDAEDRATLERHIEGLIVTPAEKDIRPGIQEVYRRLSHADDVKPSLMVFDKSLANTPDELLVGKEKPICLEDEFPGYSWPKDKAGKPLKEIPIGIDDHGLDALRYGCMYFAIQYNAAGELVIADEPRISMDEF